ncbi:MAG: LysR family transcriptional regulator [Myxococcota bacterium]
MDRVVYGDIDLNLLLVLERVLVRESVTAAAEDLGLSPSATSRALQRLREALGDPLLVRVGNRLVPTERARTLAGPAARAVEAARHVFGNPDFDPSTATGTFVIGLGEELQHRLFPALFARLRAVAPGIDLRVRVLSGRSADEGRRDVLHLAIAPDLTALVPPETLPDVGDFVHQDLYVRRYVVVGSADAWPTPPDLDAYLVAEHAIMTEEAGDRGFVDALLDERGHTRRVACSLTSFSAIAETLRHTRLLAVMPAEGLAPFGHGLVAHPPPLPLPEHAMRMVWHPRYTTRPRHRFVRRVVTEVVSGLLG